MFVLCCVVEENRMKNYETILGGVYIYSERWRNGRVIREDTWCGGP